MVSNFVLIAEAKRRDQEILGRPGLLTQMATALESAEEALYIYRERELADTRAVAALAESLEEF